MQNYQITYFLPDFPLACSCCCLLACRLLLLLPVLDLFSFCRHCPQPLASCVFTCSLLLWQLITPWIMFIITSSYIRHSERNYKTDYYYIVCLTGLGRNNEIVVRVRTKLAAAPCKSAYWQTRLTIFLCKPWELLNQVKHTHEYTYTKWIISADTVFSL